MTRIWGSVAVLTLALGVAACKGGNGSGDDGASGTDSNGTEGDTGGSDGTGEDTGPVEVPDGVGPMGLRRLTRVEYDNTVADLVGDDTRPGTALLPEDKKKPFDNRFEEQQASRVLIEAAETLAGDIATRLIADPPRRDNVVGCTPDGADDAACMEGFARTFARRALRRPLADDEVAEYTALGLDYAGQAGDFYVGVEEIVRAVLQDGEFLYRVEIGTEVEGEPGKFVLSEFEVATRMSYLIIGSTPDDALLNHAEAGDLSTVEGRREAARELLASTRARSQVDRFHAMWLGYDELPHAPALTNAMRTETAALVHRVVLDEPTSWLELFTTDETFIDDALAEAYGLPSPGGSGWVNYSDSGRQGILSHGSFLSVAANPDDTSPTKRGKLIRNRLLCQDIPPPPPDVPADTPPEAGECKVDRYAAHREPGSCKGCHDQMDPIGFGLENYDREGVFRLHDDGAPQCTIDGIGQLVELGEFSGPAELSDMLLETGGLDRCIVDHLMEYAMGREPSVEEAALIDDLAATFFESEHRFDELVVELVANDAFRFRLEEQ